MTQGTGFPSPADDFVETKLDLNEYLVHHPSATFFVRMSGTAMTEDGIFDGDILIVDRSLSAKKGSIVIATVEGEMVVKRLQKVTSEDFALWGVVTYVIHKPDVGH